MIRYSNESAVKTNGVVYTPPELSAYVAKQMLTYANLSKERTVSILDPAIGKGNLIVSLISMVLTNGFTVKAVGYETDSKIGEETKALLSRLFPSVDVDIRNGDFLTAVESHSAGAYDFVIANPPYIRTQIMGSEKAQQISAKLGLSGRIDIYYAFLVLAADVLNTNGVAGFITSNKFMTIKSGSSVRDYILNNYHLYRITDFGDTKLFNASVLPCVLIFSNGKTVDRSKVKFTSIYQSDSTDIERKPVNSIFDAIEYKGNFMIPDGRQFQIQQGVMQDTKSGALWTISSDANSEWIRKVESRSLLSFSQIGKIRVGIKTTADNAFIGNDWKGAKSDLELLRPLITHRDSGQIISKTSTGWKVLYPHISINGKKRAVDLDEFPKSKAYLLSHYEQLAGREYVRKANRKWFEIWVPQNPGAWQHKKIIFRDIADKPEFWYDETGAVVNGDCYWIDIYPTVIEDIVYLALAVANSKFIEKYYDIKFNTKLYSGKRRFQSQYVEQFPIPYYATQEAQEAISIVRKIINERNQETFPYYKSQLDRLVEAMFA